MKDSATLARSLRWISASSQERIAWFAGITWVILSAGLVAFIVVLAAAQHG